MDRKLLKRPAARMVGAAIQERLARSADGSRALDTPLVVDPDALAPLNGVTTPDGLLLASFKATGVKVTLERSVNFVAGDLIQLELDGTEFGDEYHLAAGSAGEQLEMMIEPADWPVDGSYELGYRYVKYTTGAVSHTTAPIKLVTDTKAPAFAATPDRIEFAPAVEEKQGVEVSDFISGELHAVIPGYYGSAAGDEIAITVDGASVAPIYVAEEHVAGEDIPVKLPQSAFAADGSHTIRYHLTDRAGNTGGLSEAVKINSLLKGVIDDLAEPAVPLYSDDKGTKLIDVEDARTPVSVIIPANPGIKKDDKIVVMWGSKAFPGVKVETEQVNQPIEVELSYQPVAEAWFASTAGMNEVSTHDVSYRVERYGALLAGASPALEVDANLTLAGGPDPGVNPGDPHPKLREAFVTSASNKNNQIDPSDADKPGNKISIPHLTVDSNAVFETGDVIIIKLKETTFTLDAIDAAPSADIVLSLKAEEVAALKSGSWELSYIIERPIAEGIKNTSRSPKATVKINGRDVLPGEGSLTPLEGTALNPIGLNPSTGLFYISHEMVVDNPAGVVVTIPGYTNKNSDDLIEVTLQIYKYTTDWADANEKIGTEKTYQAKEGTLTIPLKDLLEHIVELVTWASIGLRITAAAFPDDPVQADDDFHFFVDDREDD